MNPKITVDLKNMENLVVAYPRAASICTQSRITEALLFLDRVIKLATPEGAGPIHLRDTIFSRTYPIGESYWGKISTPAIYGEAVEHGTKPHFPPIAPIQHWVEKKLGYEGKAAKSIAFLIARAISKRGTKGAHMFEKTFDRHEGAVVRILKQIPSDIAAMVESGGIRKGV